MQEYILYYYYYIYYIDVSHEIVSCYTNRSRSQSKSHVLSHTEKRKIEKNKNNKHQICINKMHIKLNGNQQQLQQQWYFGRCNWNKLNIEMKKKNVKNFLFAIEFCYLLSIRAKSSRCAMDLHGHCCR